MISACRRFVLLVVSNILLSTPSSFGWISSSPPRRHDVSRQQLAAEPRRYSLPISESLAGHGEKEDWPVLITALLNISYDGAHFTGWSASNRDNHERNDDNKHDPIQSVGDSSSLPFRPSRRRRKNRQSQKKGHVRSVEGVFQKSLAKLYGDVNPSRVVVEGSSRTDKGVHATSMIAQIYCLSTIANNTLDYSYNIPGKKLPHPSSSHDDRPCFEPIPMDLPKLMYVLNRMLPHDAKVMGVAPVPEIPGGVFHPSICTESKTYQYTFSIGGLHDPINWRTTWHLEYETSFSIYKANRVCQELLLGTHDFGAFRGAPRGHDDKRKQEAESTVCTLSRVDIAENVDKSSFPGLSLSTYTVTITGDRFLYKMMRFLVGAIVAVGTDRLTFDDVHLALSSGSWEREDGRRQFTCAPPHGLVLRDVTYNIPVEWITCTNRLSTC